jgi:hypothetical protein
MLVLDGVNSRRQIRDDMKNDLAHHNRAVISFASMTYFIAQNEQQQGPYDENHIKTLLADGSLNSADLIWREGFENWVPVSEVFPARASAPAVIPLPSSVGDMQSPAEPVPQFQPQRASKKSAVEDADYSGHPWMRFFARQVDMVWFAVVCAAAIAIIESPDYLETIPEIVATLVMAPLWIIPEAIFLSLTGTTPGKALFGLFVTTNGARVRPGFLEAVNRSAGVWIFGWGLALPIVSLVTCCCAYSKVKTFGTARWDESNNLQVGLRPFSWIRLIASIGFILASVVLILFGTAIYLGFSGEFEE